MLVIAIAAVVILLAAIVFSQFRAQLQVRWLNFRRPLGRVRR